MAASLILAAILATYFSFRSREIQVLWADIATYFGHLVVAPPLQVPALILASAALLFVLADTARTVIRGKGCPVTAAMGLCLLVYLAMVTLLYDHFPSNFTPLHTVYAVSLAMAAARLAAAGLPAALRGRPFPLVPVARPPRAR